MSADDLGKATERFEFFRIFGRRIKMRTLMKTSFAIGLVMSVIALGQDTMKQDGSTKQGTTQAEKNSKKVLIIWGTVAGDGQTVVGDKGKTWKVNNPDALKGHEGHHVRVTAQIETKRNEIHIVSVAMLKKHDETP